MCFNFLLSYCKQFEIRYCTLKFKNAILLIPSLDDWLLLASKLAHTMQDDYLLLDMYVIAWVAWCIRMTCWLVYLFHLNLEKFFVVAFMQAFEAFLLVQLFKKKGHLSLCNE